jgi:ligand-binding sensor domain-containing protein
MESRFLAGLKIPATLLFMVWLAVNPVSISGAEDLLRTEYSFRRYTIHDGLPNMLLETLHVDKKGFLWVGTYKGFARFDGFTFTGFYNETAINILHFESSPGEVRAYTYHDVFIVDERDSVRTVNIVPVGTYLNTFNTRTLPPGYLIFENHDATCKYLMHIENDTIRETVEFPELNQIDDGKPFLDLQNGKLYLPSNEKKVHIYDMQTREVVVLEHLTAETFLKHSTLGILAFADDGIYSISGNSYSKLADAPFKAHKQAIEMADGSVLIKDNRSVYRFHDGTVEKYITTQLSHFWDILYDNEENVWVASHDGLYNYFRFDFKNHYLKNDFVKSFVEDDDGNYWMASYYGRLYKVTNGNAVEADYPKPEEKGLKTFLFGAASINGTLYFPRDNDVLIYEKNRFRWAGLPPDEDYSRVIPYRDGQSLTLKTQGVYLCDKDGKELRFFSEDDLKQLDLHDMIVDAQGQWIVGGCQGLSMVGDTVRLIEAGANSVNSIVLCMDSAGHIWSGSENRLNLLVGDSLVTVHRFPDNFVVALKPVAGSHLLIATLHGLYLLDIRTYFATGALQFQLYTHNNGMTGLEPLVSGLFSDSKGTFWMTTGEYLVSFNPEQLIRRNMPPLLHILACKTSTDNVNWENNEVSDDNQLDHRHGNIRFSFIGLKYSAVENVRYAYRLKGFQEEWSTPSTSREAGFNNLPPGHYTFEVVADAGTDESRSDVLAIRFTILPAFWQTWWFRTLAIALLLGGVTGIIYRYLKKKQQAAIRQANREKEMNELRVQSIRLKSIPHFNSNVLAGIEYLILRSDKEEANRLLSTYSVFTNTTLHEIDKANRTLKDEIAYTQLYLELEKMRFREKFSYEISVNEQTDLSVMVPNMVLHTYAENAIKHGIRGKKTPGNVWINVATTGTGVLMSVKDDGIGRQAAQARNPDRQGHGLSILLRQIELYNQQNRKKIEQHVIDLTDENGQAAGTCFELFVPYHYQYL